MPLIILCGIPCSGKTTKTLKIKEYFENVHSKCVHIISEADEIRKAGFDRNSFYMDSQKEKQVRAALKSEVLRLLNKDNLVILDSGNYIKGYRYELYCGSKACKSTQCTLYCIAHADSAWERCTALEEPYSREVFDSLLIRFEEPDGNNRWDSPLVVWGEGAEDNCEGEGQDQLLRRLNSALYERAPPPPNLSTQNAPLCSSTFLQQVDAVTRGVCERAAAGLLPELESSSPPAPALLARLRRQFLIYTKAQLPNKDPDTIAALFVQYLATTLK